MAEPRRGAEPLWRTPPGRLAPPHIYRMAGALGAELRRLSGRFGPDAVAGLVPPVVRLLELLEALVAPAGAEGGAVAAATGRQDAEVSGLGGPRLTHLPLGVPLVVALTRTCHRRPHGDGSDLAVSVPAGAALTRLSLFPGGGSDPTVPIPLG